MHASRIAFADSNWLFSLYYQTDDSRLVEQWWSQEPSTLVVSPLILAECHCIFWRAGRQAEALLLDLQAGRFLDARYSFESLSEEARPYWRRFSPRFNIGTTDMLHVIAARRSGCAWFLSFDSRSGCRALAAAIGLRVFPALSPEDRDILKKLKG